MTFEISGSGRRSRAAAASCCTRSRSPPRCGSAGDGPGRRARVVTPDLRGFGGRRSAGRAVAGRCRRRRRGLARRRARPRCPGRSVHGRVRRDGLPAPAPRPGRGLSWPTPRPVPTRTAARENRLRDRRPPRRGGTPRSCVDEVLPGLTGPTTTARATRGPGRVRALVERPPPRPLGAARDGGPAGLAGRAAGVEVPALVVRGDEDGLAGQPTRGDGGWRRPRPAQTLPRRRPPEHARGAGRVRRRGLWPAAAGEAGDRSLGLVHPGDGDLPDDEEHSRGDRDRDQRADDAQQRAAEQYARP